MEVFGKGIFVYVAYARLRAFTMSVEMTIFCHIRICPFWPDLIPVCVLMQAYVDSDNGKIPCGGTVPMQRVTT